MLILYLGNKRTYPKEESSNEGQKSKPEAQRRGKGEVTMAKEKPLTDVTEESLKEYLAMLDDSYFEKEKGDTV